MGKLMLNETDYSDNENGTLMLNGINYSNGKYSILKNKTVTENGTYNPEDDDADGYSEVEVNVPNPPVTTKTITENGTYNAQADSAYGYSSVTVNVHLGTLGSKTITQNGIYNASDDNIEGYSTVTVNTTPPSLDSKVITENGVYEAADDDLDGYSAVNVNVPAPTLISKTITTNGTYDPSDDDADGYSEVIVNTPSPADLLALVQNASSISNGVYITDTVLKSEATSIRRHTFRELAIYDIDMENITSVSPYAFAFSNGIISNGRIRLPSCTTIGESAFEDYSRSGEAITTFELPLVTSIGNNAFKRAKLQVPLSLPECITVGDSSFREVPLTGLSLPKCQYIYNSGFRDVYFSSDISLPAIKTIGDYAFSHTQCTNFTIGPDCTSIGGDLFMSRNGVTNLYVLATTPPSLAWEFKSGGGGVQHIYVPEDSVDAYKAASTWSSYASIIEAIEN